MEMEMMYVNLPDYALWSPGTCTRTLMEETGEVFHYVVHQLLSSISATAEYKGIPSSCSMPCLKPSSCSSSNTLSGQIDVDWVIVTLHFLNKPSMAERAYEFQLLSHWCYYSFTLMAEIPLLPSSNSTR